jgi:hypothetical protein
VVLFRVFSKYLQGRINAKEVLSKLSVNSKLKKPVTKKTDTTRLIYKHHYINENIINTFFHTALFQAVIAQNIKGKIIDSTTGESIPYAKHKGKRIRKTWYPMPKVISIYLKNNSKDETILTFLSGFVNQQLTVAELKSLDFTIKLLPEFMN